MRRTKIPTYLIVLFALTVANLIVFFIRNHLVSSPDFDWLLSNLRSAVVPLVIALVLQYFNKKLNNFFFVIISLLWLLFYPNAPYMISDLSHVNMDPQNSPANSLIIYDTLVIFSLAMLSVFYGFVSLKIIFNLYRSRFGKATAHTLVFISLCLSCLGFYMGRELLSGNNEGNGFLYSSQIFTEPLFIIKTVWHHLVPVREHIYAYYMMALFGFVQYQLLTMMKDVSDFEGAGVVSKNEPVHKL